MDISKWRQFVFACMIDTLLMCQRMMLCIHTDVHMFIYVYFSHTFYRLETRCVKCFIILRKVISVQMLALHNQSLNYCTVLFVMYSYRCVLVQSLIN